MSDSNDSRAKQEVVGQLQAMQSTQEQPIGADRSIDLAIEQGDVVAAAPTGNRRWRPWLILLFVLIVAVAVVCVSLFVVLKPSGTKQIDPLAAATRFSSPQEAVDEATPYLKGKTMDIASSDGVSAINEDGLYAYSAPVNKVGGVKFGVLPLTISGQAYVADSVQATSDYAILTQFFASHKFVKKVSQSNVPGTVSDIDENVTYINYSEYESGNLLCTINHIDATPTALASHMVSVGCASKESYIAAAQKLQPFYDAYTKSESNASPNLVFGLLRSGGSDGYIHQLVYQEDPGQFETDEDVVSLVGYYYKKSSDTKWSYLMAIRVDETPYCSIYGDDILKKSFDGLPCYDEKSQKESTVQ